ncbi:sugar ABC transporter substrate-binding protein [Bacillus sp. N1-1]|uniref:ABC transporter substrate-binding protein n=1 Tax=Bacillus sp. N1-1 TaxID=2682541 RepID=UPI0013173E72|nr:sugar ABC transporter substrate-binding protein [Bacillus sp. N1-1]QHA93662.1 extracellular solute-binding protein [Bacillus sp. N1-1]
MSNLYNNLKALNKGSLAILLMVILLTLGGCAGQNETTSSSGEEITLEFQQWWGVELPNGVLQEIVDEFTADTGINVELLSNPYADTKTQIAAGAASGTMADVVGLDGAWVYDFAKQGSIANLTELMEADGYDDSQLSDQIKVDGNTYMIPVANFAYPMYVNLDILEEAGIEEVPENWSEFIKVTKEINDSTGKAGWAIPLSTESPSGIQNNFMSWLWASGGSMLNEGKPALTNNPDLTATVEFVKELFDSGVVAPGAYAMKEASMVEEFTNGRVAFMTDSLAHLTTIKKGAPNLNVDFIPIPVKDGYSGKRGMDVANWGIGISENSEHKAEAMKFVEYLMSPEVNAKIAVYANAFPGNTKAEPDYSDADELFLKAYELYQDSYAINEFTGLPTSEELMRTFDEQLQLYLDGDTSSTADMLAETQKKWEEAFK